MSDGKSVSLKVARPGHPLDDIVVPLDENSFETLARVCKDSENKEKRVYERSAGSGWKMGGKRRAKMVLSPTSKKKRLAYEPKDELKSEDGEHKERDESENNDDDPSQKCNEDEDRSLSDDDVPLEDSRTAALMSVAMTEKCDVLSEG